MYPRKAERILAAVGLVIAGLQATVGIFSLITAQRQSFKKLLLENESERTVAQQIANMQHVGLSFTVLSGLAFILTLTAICLLSNRKRATRPAVLLITAGVLIAANVFAAGANPGLLAAVLLIAAGIIALRKKQRLF